MNPFLILSIVLAVTVIALVIYIVLDKIKRKKEIDELIEFLTKVQDRDTFPELGDYLSIVGGAVTSIYNMVDDLGIGIMLVFTFLICLVINHLKKE